MESFWQIVWTPATAVSVGLGALTTILLTYFQRRMDKWTRNWSIRRRGRYERQSAIFDSRVQLLEAQPALLPLYIAREGRLRWTGFGQLATGTLLFCMAGFTSLHKSGAHWLSSTLMPVAMLGLAFAALMRGAGHLGGADYHAAVLDVLMDADISDPAATSQRLG